MEDLAMVKCSVQALDTLLYGIIVIRIKTLDDMEKLGLYILSVDSVPKKKPGRPHTKPVIMDYPSRPDEHPRLINDKSKDEPLSSEFRYYNYLGIFILDLINENKTLLP